MHVGVVRGARPASLAILAMVLALFAGAAHAHLLNMSRVTLSVDSDGAIQAQLQLDLTRALGGSAEFHRASTLPAPLQDPQVATQMQRLVDSVAFSVSGRPLQWVVTTLTFDSTTLADYESTLVWPRATVTLRGELTADTAPRADAEKTADASIAPIELSFRSNFPFEEPIATTLSVTGDSGKPLTMTRWLVANQRFPQPSEKLYTPLQAALGESLVTPSDPPISIRSYTRTSSEFLATLGAFFVNGFSHVLPGGWDHLAFVLGLLLLANSVRSAVGLLLVYTLGHTLSYLALTLRWIPAPGAFVEVLILASIAWVGATLLMRETRTAPPTGASFAVVLAFGTVHGLGFAAGLATLPAQTEDLLSAIIGFNLGVEASQLLAAMVMALLLQMRVRRQTIRARYRQRIAVLLIVLPLVVLVYRWI